MKFLHRVLVIIVEFSKLVFEGFDAKLKSLKTSNVAIIADFPEVLIRDTLCI